MIMQWAWTFAIHFHCFLLSGPGWIFWLQQLNAWCQQNAYSFFTFFFFFFAFWRKICSLPPKTKSSPTTDLRSPLMSAYSVHRFRALGPNLLPFASSSINLIKLSKRAELNVTSNHSSDHNELHILTHSCFYFTVIFFFFSLRKEDKMLVGLNRSEEWNCFN